MASYTYTGPFTCPTLRATDETPLPGGLEEMELTLRPGTVVELPAEHPYTVGLLELGRLTPTT